MSDSATSGTIKRSLILMTLKIGITALLAAFLLFLLFHARDLFNQKSTSVRILAQSISTNAGAALAFNDKNTATELLSGVASDSTIESSYILKPDGSLFAQYGELPLSDHVERSRQLNDGAELFELYHLTAKVPIKIDGDVVGSILVVSKLNDIYERLARALIIMVIIVGVMMLFSFVAATKMQAKISGPIISLAEVMRNVSLNRDYTSTAEIKATGEIATLVDGFNAMLHEIKDRESLLLYAKDDLEERVKIRTEELSQEIRERKKIEDALRREQQQLRSILQNAPMGLALLDLEMKYIACSTMWQRDFGFEGKDIIGKSYYELFPSLPERWKEIHKRVLAGATESCNEDIFESAAGQTMYLRWVCQPWYKADGAQGGLLIVSMIINELVTAREEALRVAKLKSEFVANVSHELRTPLNAIIGYSELLTEELKSPNEYLKTILSSARLLLSLINDVLDFSKLESDKLTLEKISFSPYGVADEVFRMFVTSAVKKNINIRVDSSEELKALRVFGDPTKFRQILLNLSGNAVKFTNVGEVVIRMRIDGRSESRINIGIEVLDTGIGIPLDKQHSIFEAFSQADGSTTRVYGGTGLGLAISSKLVKAMGGELRCESQEGIGSKFYFNIDFEMALLRGAESVSESKASEPSVVSHRPVHPILVVEDNAVNQKLVMTLLRKMGYEVHVAENGADALSKVVTTPYALILMDIQMPVMDGVTATKQIRSKEGFNQCIPIVALTAHAFVEDEMRCRDAGMNDFLTKPVDKGKLVDTLNRWFRNDSLR